MFLLIQDSEFYICIFFIHKAIGYLFLPSCLEKRDVVCLFSWLGIVAHILYTDNLSVTGHILLSLFNILIHFLIIAFSSNVSILQEKQQQQQQSQVRMLAKR